MALDETSAPESDYSDRSRFEKIISAMERFGLNVARLLLALTITGAVIAFVLGIASLAYQGLRYIRATDDAKYSLATVSFIPQFSNVRLDGRAQPNLDAALVIDRVSGSQKSKNELISDRLAHQRSAGICYGGNENCRDLAYQRKVLNDDWQSNHISGGLRDGSPVSYLRDLGFPNLAGYYGRFGFGSEAEATKAEWDAVNSCLAAYKAKNGNLYIQKAPELFGAIQAQCDSDYLQAVRTELQRRPKDWTLIDTGLVMYQVWGVIACGITIIMIAMTIIFFRLEVSFRGLRNLSRLR